MLAFTTRIVYHALALIRVERLEYQQLTIERNNLMNTLINAILTIQNEIVIHLIILLIG